MVKITDQTNDLSMCGVRSKVPALSSRACQGLEKEGESKTERKMEPVMWKEKQSQQLFCKRRSKEVLKTEGTINHVSGCR